MAVNRGISGKALSQETTHYGAPVVVFKQASTTSAGTTETKAIFDGNAPFRFRVIRAWIHLTEAALGDSEDVKLTDGSNDITEVLDYAAGADNDSFEFSNYDNAYPTLDKGGSLKAVKTATTAISSFDLYVMAVRV